MPTPTIKTSFVDKPLVRWLKQQGAEVGIVHDFMLEKGMGERLELLMLNESTVQITFYGQKDIYSKRGSHDPDAV